MKTLFININEAQVENSEEIKVIKPDSDSLLNDFLYMLGKIITESIPNTSGIKLVKLFTNADGYDEIVSQWNEIEQLLFAEKPIFGKREIAIPNNYLRWLQHQNVEVLQDIYQAINDREAISINLEDFYDDSIGELQAKIVRHLKKDTSIEAVQFSSSLVTDKSQIVRYLKKRFEGLAFISYEETNNSGSIQKNDVAEAKVYTPHIYAKKLYDKVDKYTIRNKRYIFYKDNGDKLYDKEYVMVANSQDSSSSHILRNCVLTEKGKGDVAYFLSSNGLLQRIGSFNLDTGFYDGRHRGERKYWEYDVQSGVNDKSIYVLYRHNRDYVLYKILDNELVLLSKFSSKLDLWHDFIVINDMYLTSSESTINLSTGKCIRIDGYRFCKYIGSNDDVPMFLGYNEENEEYDDWNFSGVEVNLIDINGRIKCKLNYDRVEPLDGKRLLCEKKGGLAEIIDFDGNIIVNIGNDIPDIEFHRNRRTKFLDVNLDFVIDDILKIEDRYGETFFSISRKQFIANTETIFYTLENKTLSFYHRQTGKQIYQLHIDDEEELYRQVLIGDVNGKASDLIRLDFKTAPKIYSLVSNKVIYEFEGGEKLVGVNSEKGIFVLDGFSYIEIYNFDGSLLYSNDGGYFDLIYLHKNGYVSYRINEDKSQYIDGNYFIHDIIITNVKEDWGVPYICDIISDECIVLQFYGLSQNCIINSKGDVLYYGSILEQIDENIFYGCDYRKKDEEDYCVINVITGQTVYGDHEDVYVVK